MARSSARSASRATARASGAAATGPRRPTDPRISVIVPALNEADNLREVLPELPAVHEVILVDGGSIDDSLQVAVEALPGIITLTQARHGKGNALAAGLARATGDVVVMFDADGSADPAEIEDFVAALLGGADYAKGSRFLQGGASADITPLRRVGNRFLNIWMNTSFRTRFTDLCYGYNAFWTDLVPLLDLPDPDLVVPDGLHMPWGDGFEIETLITCRFASAGVAITEVPSVERARRHGESNLHAVSDGFRVLHTLRTERARLRAARAEAARELERSTNEDQVSLAS